MTRLEALEAVAAAARDRFHAKRSLPDAICPHCGGDSCYVTTDLMRCARTGLVVLAMESDSARLDDRLDAALAAFDQSAPQPPGVDPQPRRGESFVADLEAQAYGGGA